MTSDEQQSHLLEVNNALETYNLACSETDAFEREFIELGSQQARQRLRLESENYMGSPAYGYEKDVERCKMDFEISRIRENIALHNLELLRLESTLESRLILQKPLQDWLTALANFNEAQREFNGLDSLSDALLTVAYAHLEPNDSMVDYVREKLKVSDKCTEEELRVIAEMEYQNLDSKRLKLEAVAEKAKLIEIAMKAEWGKVQYQLSEIGNPEGRISSQVDERNRNLSRIRATRQGMKFRWQLFGMYWLLVLYLFVMTNGAGLIAFSLIGLFSLFYIIRKNSIDKLHTTELAQSNLRDN